MKYTHTLFSLSFLFACSFMAHAMDTHAESSPTQEKDNASIAIEQLKENGPATNKVVLHQGKSKKTGNFVHLLECANYLLNVKEQDLNNDGNLITTFIKDPGLFLILMIYEQIPGIDDIEVCTE